MNAIIAILMQIGNWAIAYFTVTMALHTCRSLVFRSPQKAWLGAMVIVIGWLSAVVVGKFIVIVYYVILMSSQQVSLL
jgi:hypothetical protein